MSHNHSHHNHVPASGDYSAKFKFGIIINLLFVLIEFVFGIIYGSLALIADAGHNLSDVIGLVIAWVASYLVTKKPTKNFTYGYKKSSILAAQLNSLILLVAVGIIIWEAVNRLSSSAQVEGGVLIIVAGIGVIINGVTTFLFFGGKDSDLNIKGAYLHMLADTLISVGVVVSGVIILFTNASWIDPVISIVIATVISWSTWKLLQDATKLSLDAVPDSINITKVKKYFEELTQLCDYHDLHIWALSTTETALTVHIIKDSTISNDDLLLQVNTDLNSLFGISHVTVQLEEMECKNGC